jgi:hypothetical protein
MDFIENLIPSSPLFFLYYLFGITVFSVVLILFFSRFKKNKPKKNKENKLTLDTLLKIAKNSKSTPKDLLSALMLFNENFTVDEDVKKSMEFLKAVLNHKNRNKSVFDYFHGNILPKNLKYKSELDKLEKEALNK